MRAADVGAAGKAGLADRIATGAVVLAVAVATAVFVLRPLSVVFPAPGLDLSWMVVLGEAATRPARWGVDLTFTYGPASALLTRYFTDGYLARALPCLGVLSFVNALTFVMLVRHGTERRGSGAATMATFAAAEIAALAAQSALDQDGLCFALALALLFLDLVRRPGHRGALAAVLAGAALLGASAMVKTSFGAAALGVFALADARAGLFRRRPPVLVPVALLGALGAFLACGQRLGDLPAYLDLQGQVAAGYGQAMYLAPNRFEVAAFLAASAALVTIAGRCGAAGRGGRVAAALGTAFVLAIAFKAGFVRADNHTQIAWSLLGFAGLSVAAALVLPRSAAAAAALAGAALAVSWVVAPLFLLAATDRRPDLAGLPEVYREMGVQLRVEVGAWTRFLRSPSGFVAAARSAKAEAWAAVRAAEPLPSLAGSVDILPSEQSAVLANGLDYRPRPSFQEYSTYTAGLIAANAASVAGRDAPDWVIFGAGGLDDRYPNSTEGALWPELLRRYEPVRRAGVWLALRRRASPLPPVVGVGARVVARLGEAVPVPVGGALFASIGIRETWLGRAAAAVFRPPPLTLRLRFADGKRAAYRFIPALGAAGFVLSPRIDDAADFASLALGQPGDLVDDAVTEVMVDASASARAFYAPEVTFDLQPLSVPASPSSADALPLRRDLERRRPWRALAHRLAAGRRLDGDHLSAQPPSSLVVPVAGARRLRVDFGIEDGAWTAGRSKGVCFALKASTEAEAPLWRRCLDPRAVEADRGPQSASFDLPPGLASVAVETTCPASCDWGWSYWSGIGPAD